MTDGTQDSNGHSRWTLTAPASPTIFHWQYDEGREKMLRLYEKAKLQQWNATDRIDWNQEVDPSNPLGVPDEAVPIFGSPLWDSLDAKRRGEVRRHVVAWQFSQFLHGEQGALICAAKVVQTVPDIDSKFYAATQVVDEARHVEVYARYLYNKLGLFYPINRHLKTLLGQAIGDSRWDFTYLAMQVIIEGLALAAFGTIRDTSTDPLARAINAYVMQDEARHVAFGRIALKDYYPHLTQSELDDRETFAIEACYLMRDRFLGEQIAERLGFDVDGWTQYSRHSQLQQFFRKRLFNRIVPTVKDIGLWGPRLQAAFVDMGVLDLAEVDLDELARADSDVAAEFDRLRASRDAHVVDTIANLKSSLP